MKKYFSIFILILCCVFTLSACGDDAAAIGDSAISSDGIGSDGISSDGIASDGTGSDGENLAQPIYVKMGFIYSGNVQTGTLNVIFETARQQVEKALGVETCYIENVLVADFEEAVSILTENEKCNVIVSCSNRFANTVQKVAKEAVDTKFISFGGENTASNLTAFEGQLYQPANVCGIIAAYNSDNNTIGIVADPGAYSSYAIIDSFILGAKEITEAKTDVRLNWARSESHDEIETAIDNLILQGCDVIMCYTGDTYAIEYCEKRGVKVIGDAYNMPELAPTQYLSGFFYQLNTYMVDVTRSIQYRNFTPSKYTEGLRAGAVRLCATSENCLDGTTDITNALYEIVRTGKSYIFAGEIKDSTGAIVVTKGSHLAHSQIVSIGWLEQSVQKINDYVTPVLEPVSSDFIVKS